MTWNDIWIFFLFHPVPHMTIFESLGNQPLYSLRASITFNQIISHCCHIPTVFHTLYKWIVSVNRLKPDDKSRKTWFFSRVLRDSISHFLVGPSVHWSVRNKVVLKVFLLGVLCRWIAENKLWRVKNYFKCVIGKKCLPVCLPDLFESADARDLGLMTLF